MIRVPQVRVVDEDGSQLGVLPTHEALRLAQVSGYELVEVAPMAAAPGARLLDYGQFKDEQARRDKEAGRHQRSVECKEIGRRVKMGQGDFDAKGRRAIECLEEGDRVKVSVQFRGRELTHAYLGRELLTKFADQIKEHGALERQPLLEGKSMSIVLASTHKKPSISAHGAEPEAPRPAQPRAATAPTNGRSPAPPSAAVRPAPAPSRPGNEPVPATSAAKPGEG